MKSALWLLGDILLLLGFMVEHAVAPAWGWVWAGAVVVWLLVGCGLLVSWLVHLLKDRVGGVKLPLRVADKGGNPTTREER